MRISRNRYPYRQNIHDGFQLGDPLLQLIVEMPDPLRTFAHFLRSREHPLFQLVVQDLQLPRLSIKVGKKIYFGPQ